MAIVAILLICLGFLGCFIDKVPGPLLAFAGILIAKLAASMPISWGIIAVCAVLVVISMVVNAKYIPLLIKKVHPYGKGGKWGTFLGSLFAICCCAADASDAVCIILLLVLPFLFAWVFEVISAKNAAEGTKRGIAAYTVFLASTLVKLAVVYICFRFTFENMGS